MVFPVVMYGCDSWTIKKTECQGINAFELWCWRRLLRVHPKGNWSWIFIGRIDAKAETLIFWSPDKKNWIIGKGPDAGKDWRKEEKGTWWDGITDSMDMSLSKLWVLVLDREACGPWCREESNTTEWLTWTELNFANIGHLLSPPQNSKRSHRDWTRRQIIWRNMTLWVEKKDSFFKSISCCVCSTSNHQALDQECGDSCIRDNERT